MEATVPGAKVLETGQFCRQTGRGGKSVLEVGCGSKMILETGCGDGFWGHDAEPCRQHREWGQAGAWVSEPREKSGHCSTTRTNDRSNKTVKNPIVNIFGRGPWRVPVRGDGTELHGSKRGVCAARGRAPRRCALGTGREFRVSRCFSLFPPWLERTQSGLRRLRNARPAPAAPRRPRRLPGVTAFPQDSAGGWARPGRSEPPPSLSG